MNPTTRVAVDQPDRAAALHLRRVVFTEGQGVPATLERDGRDADALHVVGLLAGRVVGAGRLVDRGDGTGLVQRMAVLEEARGRGVGSALLRRLERAARERGLRRLELHAQLPARGLYERAGWTASGPVFLEAGLEHVAMGKAVPALRLAEDRDGPPLISLIGSCWSAYPNCVLDVDAEEPWLRAPRSAYDRFGGVLWVADQGGTVVACCGVKPAGDGAVELKSMYVAASARRMGLAAALEARVVREARVLGATRVELWSDSRFVEAHATYAALGYARLPGSRDLHDLSATTEYPFAKRLQRPRDTAPWSSGGSEARDRLARSGRAGPGDRHHQSGSISSAASARQHEGGPH